MISHCAKSTSQSVFTSISACIHVKEKTKKEEKAAKKEKIKAAKEKEVEKDADKDADKEDGGKLITMKLNRKQRRQQGRVDLFQKVFMSG